MNKIKKYLISFVIFLGFLSSFYVGQTISPTFYVERISLDVFYENKEPIYFYKDKKVKIENFNSVDDSILYSFDNSKELEMNILKTLIYPKGSTSTRN